MPQLSELLTQPSAKQDKQLLGLRLCAMADLGQLATERADRTTMTNDLGPIRDNNEDEALDALEGRAARVFPCPKHLRYGRHALFDDGIQNLVLALEVVVEVASRDAHGIGDVGEGGVFIAPFVEQPVRLINDALAGSHVSHPGPACRALGQST